jgi:hypothetical protein
VATAGRHSLIALFAGLCLAIALLGGCAGQQQKSIFAQSPDEILESVRQLSQLPGGTRLRDYEDILGGKLVLTADERAGAVAYQVYKLTGNTGSGRGVVFAIQALGEAPRGPKRVTLHFLDVDKTLCIPMTKVTAFAAAHFQILPPSSFLGFAFATKDWPHAPTVGVSDPDGVCVGSIGIYYEARNSSAWGH